MLSGGNIVIDEEIKFLMPKHLIINIPFSVTMTKLYDNKYNDIK
jgi:hypothetical protein